MKQVFSDFASRAQRLIASSAAALKKVALSIFGQISWTPPGWLSKASATSARFTRVHPRLTFSGILLVFFFACGAGAILHWYEHRPKPRKVYATVEPIPVTGIDKEHKKLNIPALVIRFSESAARLEDLGNTGAFSNVRLWPSPNPTPGPKPSVSNVRLEPAVPGKWYWSGDQTLIFQPQEDWPADQKYRVIFDKKFFPRHILMDRLVYEAHTPPFAIKVKELKLYQDPFNPALRQVTATFELTHSIDPGELEKKVRLIMVGESSVFAPDDPAPHFAITYGLFRRTAYLRSSAVTLPEREDFMKLALSKGVRTAQGGAQTQSNLEQKVRIPSVATMFQISSVEGMIAPDKNGEPEQLLMIQTTADINTRELAKAIEVRFLPERKPPPQVEKNGGSEDEESDEAEVDGDEDSLRNDVASDDFDEETVAPRHYYYASSEKKDEKQWKSPADVPEQVFAQAKPIEFTPVPSDKAQDQQHVLRIRVESNGELYVRIQKGVRAAGDYPLTQDHNAVLPVPELPREVQIQGEGGLLALNGERKLSVRSRGLAGIEYEIARVSTTQINHLVSQTEGQFQHPQFEVPYYFNKDNISRIALEH